MDALYTKIEKEIQANVGTIVLENHFGFPRDKSNLYCIDYDGKMVWMAEKPDASTFYTRVKLNEDGDTLSAYALSGHACELSLRTGKLVSSTLMK